MDQSLTDPQNAPPRRLILTTGLYWVRWLFVPPLVALLWAMIDQRLSSLTTFWWFLGFAGLYVLFAQAKRAHFDTTTLYFTCRRTETPVPLRDVTAVKATRTKVNGSRLWRVEYRDIDGIDRRLTFEIPLFNDNRKAFIAAVRAHNPNVVVWHHPYFGH